MVPGLGQGATWLDELSVDKECNVSGMEREVDVLEQRKVGRWAREGYRIIGGYGLPTAQRLDIGIDVQV